MKKILLSAFIFCGVCGAARAMDFDGVSRIVASDACELVATGPAGDTAYRCPRTDAFDGLESMVADAMFKSAGEYDLFIQWLADTDNVYVNIVPEYNEIRVLIPGKSIDAYYAVVLEQEKK